MAYYEEAEQEKISDYGNAVVREPSRLSSALLGQDKALANLSEAINDARIRLRPISRASDPQDETGKESADSANSPIVGQIEERARAIHDLARELRRVIDHTDL